MKTLFYSFALICMIWVKTGFGATPGTMGDTPYQELGDTSLWNQLGFGTKAKLAEFAMAQVQYFLVSIVDPAQPNKFANYVYDIYSDETLQQGVMAGIQAELNAQTNVVDGKTLEAFGYLVSGDYGFQFQLDVLFVPEKNPSGGYTVPQSAINSMVPILLGGFSQISWPNIARATLVVWGNNGQLIFNGDTATSTSEDFSVLDGSSLLIAQRYTTNGYSGWLNVVLDDGTTATYDMNGVMLSNPTSIVKPLLGLMIQQDGKQVLSVSGCPNQKVTVTCSSSIMAVKNNQTSPDNSVSLTLDAGGRSTWTNTLMLGSPSAFFAVRPDSQQSQ